MDALELQMQKMLQCMEEPASLIRFMHIAAANPDQNAQSLLLFASQDASAWTFSPGQSPVGAPTIWIPRWQPTPGGVQKVPLPCHAGADYDAASATGAARLEMVLRAAGVKPAENRSSIETQFTQEMIRKMRERMQNVYGRMVLSPEQDVAALGAAYITAAHYHADVSGAGFGGLFDKGAVSGPYALQILNTMTNTARQAERALEREAQTLERPLKQAARPVIPQKDKMLTGPVMPPVQLKGNTR